MKTLSQKELETVYEDQQWIVHIPHTFKAYLTVADEFKINHVAASSKQQCFKYYNNKGPIHIIIYKPYGTKFLFHFQRDRYVNYLGERVILKEIGLSKGLIVFCKKIYPLFMVSQDFDEIVPDKDGYYIVRYEDKYNFLNSYCKIVSPNKWFNEVTPFNGEYATVRSDEKSYLLNKKGKLTRIDSLKSTTTK